MATGRGSCFLSICSSTFCFYRPSSGLTNENVLLYLSFGRLSCNKCQIVLTPWLPGLLSVRVADTNSVRSAQCWQKNKTKTRNKKPTGTISCPRSFQSWWNRQNNFDENAAGRQWNRKNGVSCLVPPLARLLSFLGSFQSHSPSGRGREEGGPALWSI